MKGTGLELEGLAIRSGEGAILQPITLSVAKGEILGIIGPAGSGKSSLLRALNRLIDLDEGVSASGSIYLDGRSLLDARADVPWIRRRIGLVFPVPTPLPLSIFENLAFGPRLAGMIDHAELSKRVERTLRAAYLWEEVKDRLDMPAGNLSGGQQQRLCLARTLMLEPEVLLLDEPCSALDPISTARIENALKELKKQMAVILVTNNVKQASRVADKTAFLLLGELVEVGLTSQIFTAPKDKRTEDYVTGRFG
jgi:phosphate transport system ATP-binding protein